MASVSRRDLLKTMGGAAALALAAACSQPAAQHAAPTTASNPGAANAPAAARADTAASQCLGFGRVRSHLNPDAIMTPPVVPWLIRLCTDGRRPLCA